MYKRFIDVQGEKLMQKPRTLIFYVDALSSERYKEPKRANSCNMLLFFLRDTTTSLPQYVM